MNDILVRGFEIYTLNTVLMVELDSYGYGGIVYNLFDDDTFVLNGHIVGFREGKRLIMHPGKNRRLIMTDQDKKIAYISDPIIGYFITTMFDSQAAWGIT